MENRLCIRVWAAALPLLIGSVAATAEDIGYNQVISFSVGAVQADTDSLNIREQSATVRHNLDYDSGNIFTLGVGIQERNLRAMLELYSSQTDIQGSSMTVDLSGPAPGGEEEPPEGEPTDEPEASSGAVLTGDKSTLALFYSLYWRPEIAYGLRGVLGAGIGYAQHELDWTSEASSPDMPTLASSMSARGWAGKIGAGLEFRLMDNLGIFALAEVLQYENLRDTPRTDGARPAYRLSGTNQTHFSLGLQLLF